MEVNIAEAIGKPIGLNIQNEMLKEKVQL